VCSKERAVKKSSGTTADQAKVAAVQVTAELKL
jgi:hypothetical protein